MSGHLLGSAASSNPARRFAYPAPLDKRGSSQTEWSENGRILIVEDDFLVSTQMEIALNEAGFEVVGTAASGEEALHLAELHQPDLTVMDIRLAGKKDGIDTALELFGLHGIRCIFASAHSDDDARRRAAAASPLGWLQKPYMMESLASLVRSAINEVRSQSG
jgi:DNA-binding NarL/FixJ family response regulator